MIERTEAQRVNAGLVDPGEDDFSARLHQAIGMVSVQLDCSVTEALADLVRISEDTEESLDNITLDVINHAVRFA